MLPVVAELERQGYRIERVNVDQNRAKALQFQVNNIPTFVVLKDGRETGRLVGGCTADTLRRLLGPVGAARAQAAKSPAPSNADAAPSSAAQTDRGPGTELVQRSARITVDDAASRAFGTGTVVRSVAGETLVVTCAHLFEGIPASAKTSVELFGAAQTIRLSGELVCRDREADVALVRVKTPQAVPVAAVASRRFVPASGLQARAVGCDNGQQPSVRAMHITAVNRYLGAPTIECSGQPVQGRSGGGLFNEAGELIGVCSAADPSEHKGIYAGLAAVHTLLGRQGLVSLFESPDARDAQVAVKDIEVKVQERTLAVPAPEQLGLKVGADHAVLDQHPGAEVICLIRSAAERNGPAKVVVLSKASADLLAQLDKEQAAQGGLAETALRLPSRPDVRPVFKQPASNASSSAEPASAAKSTQWRAAAQPPVAPPADKSPALATNP
jgi:S1-C subfamily serine protease